MERRREGGGKGVREEEEDNVEIPLCKETKCLKT